MQKFRLIHLMTGLLILLFVPATVAQQGYPGRVVTGGAYLNLRLQPTTSATVVAQLRNGTNLMVYAESSDGLWWQVQTATGEMGWVYADYVRLDDVSPVSPATGSVSSSAASSGGQSGGGLADALITYAYPEGQHVVDQGAMLQIHQQGLQAGNIPQNFSMVGDSITYDDRFMRPFAHSYDPGPYAYLQPVIAFFSQGNNSFDHRSLAAGNSWLSSAPLNPRYANAVICQPGESPLACEYRVMKPSVALIMLGSNDAREAPDLNMYAYNMERITQFTLQAGVIPVLSTLPRRAGYEGEIGAFNAVIRGIAAKYGTPLWDYYNQTIDLPNNGLSSDWLHPSSPPGDFKQAANYGAGADLTGFGVRNFQGLVMLNYVWREIMAGA